MVSVYRDFMWKKGGTQMYKGNSLNNAQINADKWQTILLAHMDVKALIV